MTSHPIYIKMLLKYKHLLTGPEGNIEVEGKQNSQFTAAPVIKCFVIPPNSIIRKIVRSIVYLRSAGIQICLGFISTIESRVSRKFKLLFS